MIIKFKVDQNLPYFAKKWQKSNRHVAKQFLKIGTNEQDFQRGGKQEAGRGLLEKLDSIGVSSESYFLLNIAGITSSTYALWESSLKLIE